MTDDTAIAELMMLGDPDISKIAALEAARRIHVAGWRRPPDERIKQICAALVEAGARAIESAQSAGRMMDEATAVAWFAAALMRGYDERDGQAAAPEWLPIESAPRDGTMVLGGCDFEELFVVAIYEDGGWRSHWDGRMIGPELQITHWQPLPAPPKVP